MCCNKREHITQIAWSDIPGKDSRHSRRIDQTEPNIETLFVSERHNPQNSDFSTKNRVALLSIFVFGRKIREKPIPCEYVWSVPLPTLHSKIASSSSVLDTHKPPPLSLDFWYCGREQPPAIGGEKVARERARDCAAICLIDEIEMRRCGGGIWGWMEYTLR